MCNCKKNNECDLLDYTAVRIRRIDLSEEKLYDKTLTIPEGWERGSIVNRRSTK